jgi:hypothetical protein
MRHTDAFEAFDQTYSYPIDRETIIETMGDRTIESPGGDDETLGQILGRTETETFDSSQDLFDTFFGQLSEQYVGRKFYDDRGDNVGTSATWL